MEMRRAVDRCAGARWHLWGVSFPRLSRRICGGVLVKRVERHATGPHPGSAGYRSVVRQAIQQAHHPCRVALAFARITAVLAVTHLQHSPISQRRCGNSTIPASGGRHTQWPKYWMMPRSPICWMILFYEDMLRLKSPTLGSSERHYMTVVEAAGSSGRKYRLTIRRNRHSGADFSVILATVAGSKLLNLIRCNGRASAH